MTLIINIPDDEYNILKSTGAWNSGLIECVKNGTPFDSVIGDIKAEIDRTAFSTDAVLKIIDKHIANIMRGE